MKCNAINFKGSITAFTTSPNDKPVTINTENVINIIAKDKNTTEIDFVKTPNEKDKIFSLNGQQNYIIKSNIFDVLKAYNAANGTDLNVDLTKNLETEI